jgi:hypothetical protein
MSEVWPFPARPKAKSAFGIFGTSRPKWIASHRRQRSQAVAERQDYGRELQKSEQQSRLVVFGFTLEGWRVVFRFGAVTLTEAGNLAVNYARDVTTVAEKLGDLFARPN